MEERPLARSFHSLKPTEDTEKDTLVDRQWSLKDPARRGSRCIGTNGETLRDKNKLAYSCHQAFPIEPLSDLNIASHFIDRLEFSEVSASSVRDKIFQNIRVICVFHAVKPVPNRIQKLVCCSRFCNSIFRIWVYRPLAYYTLQGAGLPASARLWQAEWGGREISWTLNELTWLINMCTFWVHDESKAVQTFLMHFIADSRKINATSGMYFSQL
jgi:hypothetical protein